MKVPSPWLLVDLLFGIAERVERYGERRRERRSVKREAKARGLPWKDVARQRAMAASAARPFPGSDCRLCGARLRGDGECGQLGCELYDGGDNG